MARRSEDPGIWAALEALYGRAKSAGLKPREVAGVSLGGCCEAIGTQRKGAFRRVAHAHVKGEHQDWICVLSDKESKLVTPAGRPTALLIHEYGHVVTHAWHTKVWGAAVANLGAPGEAKKYAERAASRHRHAWSEWDERGNGQAHRHCLTCEMSETWFGAHPPGRVAARAS